MSLREELAAYRLGVRKVDLKRLPSAHVREWDGLARSDVVGRISQLSDEDGDVAVSDAVRLHAFVAVRSLCDEQARLAYAPEDEAEMVAALSGEDIQTLAEAAMDLNGLGAEAVEQAAGKS